MQHRKTFQRAFPKRALSDAEIERLAVELNPWPAGSAGATLWEAEFRLDQFQAHLDPRRSVGFAAALGFVFVGVAGYVVAAVLVVLS